MNRIIVVLLASFIAFPADINAGPLAQRKSSNANAGSRTFQAGTPEKPVTLSADPPRARKPVLSPRGGNTQSLLPPPIVKGRTNIGAGAGRTGAIPRGNPVRGGMSAQRIIKDITKNLTPLLASGGSPLGARTGGGGLLGARAGGGGGGLNMGDMLGSIRSVLSSRGSPLDDIMPQRFARNGRGRFNAGTENGDSTELVEDAPPQETAAVEPVPPQADSGADQQTAGNSPVQVNTPTPAPAAPVAGNASGSPQNNYRSLGDLLAEDDLSTLKNYFEKNIVNRRNFQSELVKIEWNYKDTADMINAVVDLQVKYFKTENDELEKLEGTVMFADFAKAKIEKNNKAIKETLMKRTLQTGQMTK